MSESSPDTFDQRKISFIYTNWRGETRERAVVPIELVFGQSKYHEGLQWLLIAIDAEREELPIREFAINDIVGFTI